MTTKRAQTRADQLRAAIERCEVRLRIAHRNLRECSPEHERTMMKVRGDYVRARDDLAWMRNRLDEALDPGSAAFKRDMVSDPIVEAAK